MNKLNINDEMTLGKYNDLPIEWKVLDIKDNTALIITKQSLFNYKYKDSPESDDEKKIYGNSYKDSDIRKYLNNEFYNQCFNNEEKKLF